MILDIKDWNILKYVLQQANIEELHTLALEIPVFALGEQGM